jgi:transcriptional regulator with XRE-family HTH domain
MANEAIDLAALGHELRRLRLKSGLTQEELCRKIGIHRNSLSSYEAGSDLPVMVFLRLCVELKGSIPEILERVLKS